MKNQPQSVLTVYEKRIEFKKVITNLYFKWPERKLNLFFGIRLIFYLNQMLYLSKTNRLRGLIDHRWAFKIFDKHGHVRLLEFMIFTQKFDFFLVRNDFATYLFAFVFFLFSFDIFSVGRTAGISDFSEVWRFSSSVWSDSVSDSSE